MRVPIFEFDLWRCEYGTSGHVFTAPGKGTIVVSPGDFPGQLIVRRNVLWRLFSLSPTYYGPPSYFGDHGGGDAGGQGIVLKPEWTPQTQLQMDGTIRRHPIGFFNSDGTPWVGDGKRYPLAATPQPNGYEKIDGPHYIRAYSHAVALWAHDRDPVARMWLILCARDVLRRFPLVPFIDGEGPEYSLATMHKNVFLYPHLAKLGVVRELAHCLRCVVEAVRATRGGVYETWIAQFVEMIYMGQALNGAYADNYFGEGASEQDQPWTVQQLGFRLLSLSEGEQTSWQRYMMNRALVEAGKLLPRTMTHVRECLKRDKAIYDTCARVPDRYHPENMGLPYWLVTSRDGQLLPAITEGIGLADTTFEMDTREAYREAGL